MGERVRAVLADRAVKRIARPLNRRAYVIGPPADRGPGRPTHVALAARGRVAVDLDHCPPLLTRTVVLTECTVPLRFRSSTPVKVASGTLRMSSVLAVQTAFEARGPSFLRFVSSSNSSAELTRDSMALSASVEAVPSSLIGGVWPTAASSEFS